MPYLSTRGVRSGFLYLGQKYSQELDMGWFEYYGGQGFHRVFMRASRSMQVIQDNNIKIYILVLVLWVLVLAVFI